MEATLELRVMIGRMAHLLTRAGHSLRSLRQSLLGDLRGDAHRVGRSARLLPGDLAGGELGTQRIQLGTATQWTGAADLARKPDGAVGIYERTAVGDCLDAPEEGAYPIARSGRRADNVREGATAVLLGSGGSIQGAQQ